MSCWVFFRRCSLCRGLANTAMHLTRPLQLPVPNEIPSQQLSAGRRWQALGASRQRVSCRHGHQLGWKRLLPEHPPLPPGEPQLEPGSLRHLDGDRKGRWCNGRTTRTGLVAAPRPRPVPHSRSPARSAGGRERESRGYPHGPGADQAHQRTGAPRARRRCHTGLAMCHATNGCSGRSAQRARG